MCSNFSQKTVLMLAEQLISRLDYIHSKGFIHCDLKVVNCIFLALQRSLIPPVSPIQPSNFCVGAGSKANIVYLIDFGLAKRYTN